MTDDVVGLMTNDLLGENVLLLTKRGHLSLYVLFWGVEACKG